MLEDCIKMYIGAFCRTQRFELQVKPEADAVGAAEWISMLLGKAEISTLTGKVRIKPPKKQPSPHIPLPVRCPNKDSFFMICGIAAQLELIVKFTALPFSIQKAELEAVSRATQGLMQWAKKSAEENELYACCLLAMVNPKLEECSFIPAFGAGILVGAALSRYDTLVSQSIIQNTPLYSFVMEELRANGIIIQEKGEHYCIHSIRSRRFPGKKQKTSKSELPQAREKADFSNENRLGEEKQSDIQADTAAQTSKNKRQAKDESPT